MEGLYCSKDVASLILSDLQMFSPIELMRIARVCKGFYKFIKEKLSDYGIKANLETLLKVKGCGTTVDHIVETCFIFGSFLLCALHMRNGNSDWYPNDLDIFTSVIRLPQKTGYLKSCLKIDPKLQIVLEGAVFNGKRCLDYDGLDAFTVFSNNKVDFVVGIRNHGETEEFACWKHICRSDIPMHRSIYGPNGFKTQSVESFFQTQGVPLRCSTDTVLDRFMEHVRKFCAKNLQNVELILPCNDSRVFRKTIQYVYDSDKIESLKDLNAVKITLMKTIE